MAKKLKPFGEHKHYTTYNYYDLEFIIGHIENLLDEECENYDCTKDVRRSKRSKRVELVEQALEKLRDAAEL